MKQAIGMLAASSAVLLMASTAAHADSDLDKVIAAAKMESGAINVLGGPATFGGTGSIEPLEQAFLKKYGIPIKVNFAPGPSMPAMGARLEQEYKAGTKATTDIYIGTESTFAPLVSDHVLAEYHWAKTFDLKPELEVVPGQAVLVSLSISGMTYNATLLAPADAPKSLEDLIDPVKSRAWAGKMAVPVYSDWLVNLSLIWPPEKVLDFARTLTHAAAGFIRYSQGERIASGEFALMANEADALQQVTTLRKKGAQIDFNVGVNPALDYYVMFGVPKNAPSPNLAALFSALNASPEGQEITNRLYDYGHQYEPSNTTAKYLAAHHIQPMDGKKTFDFYLKGSNPELTQEIEQLLKR